MKRRDREIVRDWLTRLEPRQVARAVDEVARTVQGRTFEALVTGEDVDDELLAGVLLVAWLREQVG